MRFQSGRYLGLFAAIGTLASPLVITTVDHARAVSPSGTAVSVVPNAAAAGTTGRRTLQVDGDVFMGDKVQTGPGGEAQIQFKDSTKLVVGPNSSMTIDAFVFDANNKARKITMNAAKGAFRFITGTSQKQAYTINTPTSTIGIRGTRFDFIGRRQWRNDLCAVRGPGAGVRPRRQLPRCARRLRGGGDAAQRWRRSGKLDAAGCRPVPLCRVAEQPASGIPGECVVLLEPPGDPRTPSHQVHANHARGSRTGRSRQSRKQRQ